MEGGEKKSEGERERFPLVVTAFGSAIFLTKVSHLRFQTEFSRSSFFSS